jgi:hypothetical protein
MGWLFSLVTVPTTVLVWEMAKNDVNKKANIIVAFPAVFFLAFCFCFSFSY